MKFEWRIESAYDDLVMKHHKFLENHEIIRLRSLEQEELDSIDASLRAIKEVKKIYKAPNFDRTGYCNVVVEKKFENLYVEQIDKILCSVDQKDNRKFKHPPNRVKNASEQISKKNMERYNKEYANKPVPSAWNVSNKNVGNIGNDDKWGTDSVTTDITTPIQLEEHKQTKGKLANLEKAFAVLQKDQAKTAKIADNAMSKIDQVQLTAEVHVQQL